MVSPQLLVWLAQLNRADQLISVINEHAALLTQLMSMAAEDMRHRANELNQNSAAFLELRAGIKNADVVAKLDTYAKISSDLTIALVTGDGAGARGRLPEYMAAKDRVVLALTSASTD